MITVLHVYTLNVSIFYSSSYTSNIGHFDSKRLTDQLLKHCNGNMIGM